MRSADIARSAACLLVFTALTGWAGEARAHPLAPALLQLRETSAGRVDVLWRLPRARPPGGAPLVRLPDRCRRVTEGSVATVATYTEVRWTVDCGDAGIAGAEVEVTGLVAPLSVVVRAVLADGYASDGIVTAGEPRFVVAAAPSPLGVGLRYFRLGVVHIAVGPDHLLFILGLLLLTRTWRRMAVTVTAFTVGHSVTLALAALGLVKLPAGPIELAIALSVLWVAVQVARNTRDHLETQRPWLIAGCFGLLHGLGFAGALAEVGLPRGALVSALLAFNLGIEAGQLAFVLALLGLGAIGRQLFASSPAWVARGPVYAMGTLAAYWCWVRAAAWLGV
jgi:hydrogenase/urease accessory protein HupE